MSAQTTSKAATKKLSPQRLFKYCPPDRIDILRTEKIRFTAAKHLNDPFEINANPDFSGFSPKDAETLTRHATLERDFIARQWGILSLTDNESSLQMWAHYASGHTGFLIEFELTNQFFDPEGRRPFMIGPNNVDYGKSPPVCPVSDLNAFLHKGADWGPEREWRMFAVLEDAPEKWGDLHLFHLPPTAVKAIYLGCRMSEELRADWSKFLAKDSRYSHVALFSSEPEFSTHSIKHNQISGPRIGQAAKANGPIASRPCPNPE